MFDDIFKKENVREISEASTCENCDVASYILSDYPLTKILCQKTGIHMGYNDWCEKWEKRCRVKLNS